MWQTRNVYEQMSVDYIYISVNLDVKTGCNEFTAIGDKPREFDCIKILWSGRPVPSVGQDFQENKCGFVYKVRMYGILWSTYAFSVATKHKQSPSLLRKFLCLKAGISLSQTYYTETEEKKRSM